MTGPEVLVLGGGPAGLAATLALARAGRDAVAVERAPFVGGLTRTIEHQGFRFDLGGHRFYTKNAAVQHFVEELLGADLLEVPRLSRIHFRGRYLDYPIKPWNALRCVDWVTQGAILRDLVRATFVRKPVHPRSLEHWMIAQFGRRLYETFFKVYAEKVWGIPAHRIHADLAAQRVKGLGLRDTVRNALFPRSARARASMVDRFHYPRFGYGQICERMQAALAPRGALRLSTWPVRLGHDGRRIRTVELQDLAGATSHADPEHVISSIPITALLRSLDPAPPQAVQDAAAALGFRAVVFVAVFLDRPSVRDESWIYFPSAEISFGRMTEPRNWSRELAPAGRTSLVTEHFCDEGDPTWTLSDDQLVARTVHDLTATLGLFRPDEVLGARVVRTPRAYPRMDVEHKTHLGAIEAWLDRFTNLQVIGRGGMYRYHNTDHVIETGLAAAENVLGGHRDVRAINSELCYHETRTVPCSRAYSS